MSEKHDQEQVTKGAVKEAIKKKLGDSHSFTYRLMLGAIDKLPAEPQGKDCVERDEVLNLLHDFDDKILKETLRYLRVVIKDLPSVFPARQTRPNEEIEQAIKRLTLEPPPKELEHLAWGWRQSLANLVRWIFKQKQGGQFAHTDKGLLGKEQKKVCSK